MHKIWKLEDFSLYLDSDVEILVSPSSSTSTAKTEGAETEGSKDGNIEGWETANCCLRLG